MAIFDVLAYNMTGLRPWLYRLSFYRRVTAMSTSGEESDGSTLGNSTARTSRNTFNEGGGSNSVFPRTGSLQEAQHQSDHSPDVNTHNASLRLPNTQDTAPWDVVLSALTELRADVNKLKKDRLPPYASRVNEGASTSQGEGTQPMGSPGSSFSGFPEPEHDGEALTGQSFGDSVLRYNAKVFGPPDTDSEEIDQQVAEMVNFLFTKGMRVEDYKLICEDVVLKKPKNCHALTPVECNPEVLDALRSDAKKTDHRLKDVSKDILRAATILTKSLLALDKVAQDVDHPVVAREVGLISGALALLGNATYKNNLARRYVMKREINNKYTHLCTDKVPVTRYLFGDDVSHSAKQIEETEKLRNKFMTKKLLSTWTFAAGRTRGYWGSTSARGAYRFQPYGQPRQGSRAAPRHPTTRHDAGPKNAKGRGQHRPHQQ